MYTGKVQLLIDQRCDADVTFSSLSHTDTCPKIHSTNTVTSLFGALNRARWPLVDHFDIKSQLLSSNLFPGWRVDNDSPVTVSTA